MFIILCVGLIAASCGSKNGNKVDSSSGATTTNAVTPVQNEIKVRDLEVSSFTGSYEIERKDFGECSNTIRIVSDCSGLKVMEYGYRTAEEFCNINKGSIRLGLRNDSDDRNPPNPDRNPPNPDNSRPETRTVTLIGNEVKSILAISDRVAFTNSIKVDGEYLLKSSDLKSHKSVCLYKKIITY